MEDAKRLLEVIGQHLERLAEKNAVVGTPVSVGDRHVIPLCELRLALGAGGGSGEAEQSDDPEGSGAGSGMGGGAGASAKAEPVAVIVVDGQKVRIERIG